MFSSPPTITASANAEYRPANSERHYCRNPRCRSKLPTPVSNPREAFCTKGCHSSFYRNRCLICEGAMVRKAEHQLICGKRRCRNALQARLYGPSSERVTPLKTSIKPGFKIDLETDRAWRIVAGLELTPTQLHCATMPPDPKLVARLTRQHKQYYCDAAKSLIGPTDLPINKIPGLTRPRCPLDRAALSDLPIPADLTIPDFLRRTRATP